MLDGITQQHTIPDELLGPLVEATSCLSEPELLRRSFADNGYVLLRDVLPQDDVLAARSVRSVGGDGRDTGPGRGWNRDRHQPSARCSPDLGAFWKSVSEGAALRHVTHGPRLRELTGLLFDARLGRTIISFCGQRQPAMRPICTTTTRSSREVRRRLSPAGCRWERFRSATDHS